MLLAACAADQAPRPLRPCPGPSFDVVNWTPRVTAGTQVMPGVYACEPVFPRPLRLTWQVADTTVARITPESDSTAVLRAIAPGRTLVTLTETRRAWMSMTLDVVASAAQATRAP